MSYRPPASRMRQIKRDAPPPINRHANVEAAIQQLAAEQAAGAEVAEEIRVPVGAIDAVITPGPDAVFGTPDDEVTLEAHKEDDAHEHVEPAVDEDEPLVAQSAEVEAEVEAEPEAEPEAVVQPEYSKSMTKKELQALAEDHGVVLKGMMSKAKIVAALDRHFAK